LLAPTPAHPSARSNAPAAADETLELETLDDIELETVDDELGVTLDDTELDTVTEDTATEAEDDELPLSMLTLPPPQAVRNAESIKVEMN
jgi:hypothetical protein